LDGYAMVSWFEGVPSRSLGVFVAAADVFVWCCALPFELYCRHLLTQRALVPIVGPAILAVNLMLVALVFIAIAATSELLRRGVKFDWLRQRH
jgi:hypothetical protein